MVSYKLYQSAGVMSTNMAAEDGEPELRCGDEGTVFLNIV